MREEEAPDPADVVSWEERRLCPDGSCLGVVGADGACNECGRVDPEAARLLDARAAAKGEAKGEPKREPKRELSGEAVDSGESDGEGDGDGEEGGTDGGAAGSRAVGARGGELGDDWQRRQLCEDGACIGVVIDGRCNTCGKAQ